jgi:hypothetical protein
MIVGTLAVLLLLFGGGGIEFYLTHLKSDVKEHVQDKERQAAVIDASKALSKHLKSSEKKVDAHFHEWVGTHNNFSSTPADFDAVTAKLIADQKDVSGRILDARDAMHKALTRDEWKAIFGASGK